jgi:hypothetical protein
MSREDDDADKDIAPRVRARALIGQGKSVWDIADEYALEALIVRHDDLDCADEKVRAGAARDLLYAWSRLPPRPALPPEKGITQEEFTARMDAAEQDAAVRAFLVKKGWEPPATKGTGN